MSSSQGGTTFYTSAPPGMLPFVLDNRDGRCYIKQVTTLEQKDWVPKLRVGDQIISVGGKELENTAALKKSRNIPTTWSNLLCNRSSYQSIKIIRPGPNNGAVAASTAAKKPAAIRPFSDIMNIRTAAASRKTAPVVKKKAKIAKKAPPAKKALAKENKVKTSTQSKAKQPKEDKEKIEYYNVPAPGCICRKKAYYSTLNNETPSVIAEKLGVSNWRQITQILDNVNRYGKLAGNTLFKKGTLLRIPESQCSPFQIGKLVDKQEEFLESLGTCMVCHKRENPSDPNDPPMLLCDGCDVACHLSCKGLTEIPKNEWFCESCLDILKARQTLTVLTPKIPTPTATPTNNTELITIVMKRLRTKLDMERNEAVFALVESAQAQKEDLVTQREQMTAERGGKQNEKFLKEQQYEYHISRAMRKEGITACDSSNITLKQPDGSCLRLNKNNEINRYVSCDPSHPDDEERWQWPSQQFRYIRPVYSQRWKVAAERQSRVCKNRDVVRTQRELQQLTDELETIDKNLPVLTRQIDAIDKGLNKNDLPNIKRHYAAMLGEPQLETESRKAYRERECQPQLMGFVKMHSDVDILSLEYLQEPTPFVFIVPTDDSNTTGIQIGKSYAIFARDALFDQKRDDELPIAVNGERTAQRHLFQLLLDHPLNTNIKVSSPKVPSSVRLRGDDEDGTNAQCYDLSELVRDCNCPLENMPRAETPAELQQHGLQLRDYQKASLQWMLDKEQETNELGVAGELWSQMQTFEGKTYFYCSLTGTFSRRIFEDVQQTSGNLVGLPCGGILGEEMGLGKTIICLALICANPPPKHYKLLPREYKLEHPVAHETYSAPPLISDDPKIKKILSNATLVVAPVTLCSQWKSEIAKFAPHLNVLTLHNTDSPKLHDLASADILVLSTFVLSQAQSNNGCRTIFNLIKRIHWHRLIVDESHYNQSGYRTKESLGMISSTFRWCSTGTPVGHSLTDLLGQLQFLRIPQFSREHFWKNNIDDGYYNHNDESLRVLRALLSRVIIRHSKEQTLASGQAMLMLPPRTVTTEFLAFGSEAEKRVYEAIERRNQKRFLELRKVSPEKVLSNYLQLNSMMIGARQACSHVSMVDLFKMERLNNELTVERERQKWNRLPDVSRYDVVQKGTTRESIMAEAVAKARPSAQNRVRHIIRQFQEGHIQFMECPICLDPFDEVHASISPCGHPFCSECVLHILDGGSGSREASGQCPTCRTKVKRSELVFLGEAKDAGKIITKDGNETNGKPEEVKATMASSNLDENNKTQQINGFTVIAKDTVSTATLLASHPRITSETMSEEDRTYLQSHLSTLSHDFLGYFDIAAQSIGSKISRLLEEISNMIKKKPTSKCVVFSQYLGVLDVAAQEMAVRDIPFVRVDGSRKQHQRADALQEFSNNPDTKVFLLSMRAGAVGLTLIAADHCFILDPPTNAAVEEQAIDRIHRIGQTRPVTVKRFIMKDTCEERILLARRSLVSEGAGTQLDGITASIMCDENRPSKKARLEDEANIADEKRYERLKALETLFGVSSAIPATNDVTTVDGAFANVVKA